MLPPVETAAEWDDEVDQLLANGGLDAEPNPVQLAADGGPDAQELQLVPAAEEDEIDRMIAEGRAPDL